MKTDYAQPTMICGYCGQARTTSACECRAVQDSRAKRAQEMEGKQASTKTAYSAGTSRRMHLGQCR